MNYVKIQDLVPGSTVEIILHHNYPLEISKTKSGLKWVVSQNKSGAKAKFVTHVVGRLMANNNNTHTLEFFGGPYSGQGLGRDMPGQGENYSAAGSIPWNYVMRMWVVTRKDIPTISSVYGRMNVIKTAVKF
tara:strand:+ start:5737 stop:6132 length:396 start_codon:yes stop_codon:yes gene_type:complete